MDETPQLLPSTPQPPAKPTPLWRESVQEFDAEDDSTGPAGLGGWLTLVTIGFIFVIPSLTYHLIVKWKIFFARPGVWQRLTTPGSPAYHPLWSTVMIYETAGNAMRLLCCIALAVLFFSGGGCSSR